MNDQEEDILSIASELQLELDVGEASFSLRAVATIRKADSHLHVRRGDHMKRFSIKGFSSLSLSYVDMYTAFQYPSVYSVWSTQCSVESADITLFSNRNSQ
jgi:hypothetical protein